MVFKKWRSWLSLDLISIAWLFYWLQRVNCLIIKHSGFPLMCLNKCFSAQHTKVFLVPYLHSPFSIKSLAWICCSRLFSLLFSLSCLLSGRKSGSVRWSLSRGRQRWYSFCFPFHSVPYLLSIEEIHQSLPIIKQHKHINSPERRCSCWNPVSLTILDQRQSVSIVHVGSKIKASKTCKNNKQKSPKQTNRTPPEQTNVVTLNFLGEAVCESSALVLRGIGMTVLIFMLFGSSAAQEYDNCQSLGSHSLTAVTDLPQNKATICLCKDTSSSLGSSA